MPFFPFYLFLILFILTFKQKRQTDKFKNATLQAIYNNPLSMDEIKDKYQFDSLPHHKKILKLFFNKDKSNRFIILQESNVVKVSFQKLNFYLLQIF